MVRVAMAVVDSGVLVALLAMGWVWGPLSLVELMVVPGTVVATRW